jgi:protein-glutamine gamma-glutamyltransferase
LAPFFASESYGDSSKFQFDRDNWHLIDTTEDLYGTPDVQRRKYSFYTLAFQRGKQTRFVPESEELAEEVIPRARRAAAPYQQFGVNQLSQLLEFRKEFFPGLIALRDRIIANSKIDASDPLDRALELENYFATNPEFSYTLNLTMTRDRSLDATEDFVVNQKRGHCQYFASALALMLRAEGIPTRLVNGLRPIEYNELGNYLLVRQSHAHTWVEAYFTKEQFTNSRSMPFPSNYKDGAWVRFDPTPAGAGSNSRRPLSKPPGATWDFAQQLWKDYVIQVDRSDRSSMLEGFGALTGEGYQDYFERFQTMSNSGRLPVIGWLIPRGDGGWVQWLRLIVVVVIAWLLWRNRSMLFRLPLPGISRRRKRQQRQVTFDFYKRCIRALEKLGWQRPDDMTHREFANYATGKAKERYQLQGADFPLSELTQAYCDLRYGQSEVVDPKQVEQLEDVSKRFEATLQQQRPLQNGKPE